MEKFFPASQSRSSHPGKCFPSLTALMHLLSAYFHLLKPQRSGKSFMILQPLIIVNLITEGLMLNGSNRAKKDVGQMCYVTTWAYRR